MADQSSSHSICANDVCSSPSFYPSVTVWHGDSDCDNGNRCSKSLHASDRKKIACFQCNMKSCHRYGVNTHVNIHDPDACCDTRTNTYHPTCPVNPIATPYKSGKCDRSEPLDGLVPECVVESAISLDPDKTELTSATDMNNKCLKTISGGKLQAVTCSNTSGAKNPRFKKGQTKSACFSEGRTRVLQGGYTEGLDARLNCMQNLQEEQLIGEKDENQVWREGVLPSLAMAYPGVVPSDPDPRNRGAKELLEGTGGLPVKGDKYVFNNYARFSTFFGDHRAEEVKNEVDVFVPYQRDSAGMFHSGWQMFLDVAESGTLTDRDRWAFFYREPFSSIDFHDADQVGAGVNPPIALPDGRTREQFLGRTRPSRPVYIKMSSEFGPDYPNKQNNNDPPNHYLGLIHHLAFKGIRPIKTPSAGKYPYLCRNINASTYKEAFVTTTAKGNVMSDGYDKCRALGSGWYFIPPDSRQLWASALQAVAPNAPRYPFPNPFNFVDGVPFWTELKSGDTGYDSKKRQWKLSYEYRDNVSSKDYLSSESSDNEFFFNENRGVLATPETAWIGGLLPNNQATGARADKSYEWKPDWSNILGSTLTSGDPETGPSLLFSEDRNASQINNIIGQLNADTNMSNIGAINHNGRVMTYKSLRKSGSLDEFQNAVKLCRYSEDKTELDFHKALMITGSVDDWPDDDTCTELEADSFLSNHVESIYFKTATAEEDEMGNLTGSDFVEIRKGIRALTPLLAYHKHKAIHVQNTDKFCRLWKREKKRRAVGNCIVKGWNNGTLSVDGEDHGYTVAKSWREAKTGNNTCHKDGKFCDKVVSYYSNARSLFNDELARAGRTVSHHSTLKAMMGGKWRYYECPSNRTKAESVRRAWVAYKGRLNTAEACARMAVHEATKSNCIDAISDAELNHQSYTPPALENCSKDFFGTSKTFKYNFNSTDETRCWNLKSGSYGLHPEKEVTFDGNTGNIGIVADSEADSSWSKNASCFAGARKLETISSKCGGRYADLADLNFCGDSGVNYNSETCEIDIKNTQEESSLSSGSIELAQSFDSIRPEDLPSKLNEDPDNCPTYP